MGPGRGIAAYGGGILCLAVALSVMMPSAGAATQNASFQVSAEVRVSCALPALPPRSDGSPAPLTIACGRAPSMSAIVAPPPRAVRTTENGKELLVLEF